MVLAFSYTAPILPHLYWPDIEVGEIADFTYDCYADVVAGGVIDPVISATFATNPSGAGEVVASDLTVTVVGKAVNVTVWLSDATVPGRTYIHRLTITTLQGRTLVFLIGQVVDPFLETVPIPPAPTPTFGTPIVWPAQPATNPFTVDFTVQFGAGGD